MATIQRTPESRVDYLEIFVFVGEQNLPAAERLIEIFDQKLELLADMPGLGPARPELGKGIRSFPVGNYIIFYRAVDGGIELLRVLHGARNIRKIFRKK
jgi:toxin ParE1/3/4